MILGARYCSDYNYFNHNGKWVCFNYNSKKRVKTRVINFLKNEHEEGKINIFLRAFGLELVQVAKSKKYLHYDIVDIKE